MHWLRRASVEGAGHPAHEGAHQEYAEQRRQIEQRAQFQGAAAVQADGLVFHQGPAGEGGADEQADRRNQCEQEQMSQVVRAVGLLFVADLDPGPVRMGHQRYEMWSHGVSPQTCCCPRTQRAGLTSRRFEEKQGSSFGRLPGERYRQTKAARRRLDRPRMRPLSWCRPGPLRCSRRSPTARSSPPAGRARPRAPNWRTGNLRRARCP